MYGPLSACVDKYSIFRQCAHRVNCDWHTSQVFQVHQGLRLSHITASVLYNIVRRRRWLYLTIVPVLVMLCYNIWAYMEYLVSVLCFNNSTFFLFFLFFSYTVYYNTFKCFIHDITLYKSLSCIIFLLYYIIIIIVVRECAQMFST